MKRKICGILAISLSTVPLVNSNAGELNLAAPKPVVMRSQNFGLQARAQIFAGTASSASFAIKSGQLNLGKNERPASAGAENSRSLPQDFRLEQNYPNPFNPTTTISFALPQTSEVILKVFNALGREVATVVEEELHAGTHDFTFNADNLPSGVYFYRLKAKSFSQVKRMTLLK